jgi:nitrite reductase/ring-hydroxylating ferredoxin subunit
MLQVEVAMGERRVDVGATTDVEPDTIVPIQVEGVDIILVRDAAGLRAFQGTCTHEYYRLSEGWIDRGGIVCALHLSRFDLGSGEVLEGPAALPLARYRVEEVAGRIVLVLPDGPIPVNE